MENNQAQQAQNEQMIENNNQDKENNNMQPENNIYNIKMTNINNKFDYFKNTKDIYDKLFIHEYIENIHLIENNQELMDKKLNYLKMNKDYYNNKKQEINFKLQLKRRTKNLFYEELSKGKKSEKNDSYFHISPEAFEYNHNNKNILYKSDGLVKI